jgi:hypothetical protein
VEVSAYASLLEIDDVWKLIVFAGVIAIWVIVFLVTLVAPAPMERTPIPIDKGSTRAANQSRPQERADSNAAKRANYEVLLRK